MRAEIDSLPADVAAWIRLDPSGCWMWTGKPNQFGYGRIARQCREYKAHRYVFELVAGAIPDGLVIDHLCRVRLCVNPAHLEVVTQRENVLRGEGRTAANAQKTHCTDGHEYTAENTAIFKGKRYCRTCRQGSARRTRQEARRALSLAS